MKRFDVAILGGGAAGLMAANLLEDADLSVCIIEKNEHLGRKLLSTGNGRCNFSNKKQGLQFFNCHDPAFVTSILNEFTAEDICSFFNDLGLIYKDVDGYLYPYSNQASSVVDALTSKLISQVICKSQVKKIISCGDYYSVEYVDLKDSSRNSIEAKYVLCAMGGSAAPALGTSGDAYYILSNLGIESTKVSPALCPMKSRDVSEILNGVRCSANLELIVDTDKYNSSGEIQFNQGQISGIPAFCLSRHVSCNPKADIIACIDFYPEVDIQVLSRIVNNILSKSNSDELVIDILANLTHRSIVEYILKLLKFDKLRVSEFSDVQIAHFIERLKKCMFHIDGTFDFDKAQVTAGGVSTNQIDSNCQVKDHKNLFILGETLDVDGICGGYNITFAFASAKVACNYILEDVK